MCGSGKSTSKWFCNAQYEIEFMYVKHLHSLCVYVYVCQAK